MLDLVEPPLLGVGLSKVATIVGDLLSDDKLDVGQMTTMRRAIRSPWSNEPGTSSTSWPTNSNCPSTRSRTTTTYSSATLGVILLRSGGPAGEVRDDRWRVT